MSAKKRGKKPAADDPHRQREGAKYEKPIASREFITTVLLAEKGPMDFEALAQKLELLDDDNAMEALRRRVGAMLRDGQLIQNRKRGLVPVDTEALIAGRISAHADGFGFVIADDGDKDVYLNGKQMRQVLHGDRVVVCITGIDHRGRREGRIVDVVERANKSLVGRISIDRGTVVVLPDNKRIHQDLLIAPGELADASDGDMVVAEIIEQPTRRHQPVGKIVEVLGQHLRPGMEIDVSLHSHGIPVEWSDEVIDQAAGFSTIVDEKAAKGRKDVRDLSLITIDGADARDFDDAVWCERLDKGWRLFVAIADVAHYVSQGSPLDKEAVERGTSVYFPGRVVPMLPEVLSNGLCSLNPDVDRLCMLCEMTLDEKGVVKKTRFHNGIMRSHARLTYDQVSEMLTDDQSALRDQYSALVPMIEELHRLYKTLAKKRRRRGAIEFDSNETHILFDDNKKIREIIPIQRNDAHKLIEECMILANIEAAAYLEEKEIPALYRVHAGPKADRLEDLRAFLALRSLTLGGGELPSALDYAALAETISERPDRSVIQTVMLRSMQQAVYQPNNEGHFGLALDQYAHFTSPIRRYPDLLVHRALKYTLLRGKKPAYLYTKEAMQMLGESCSMTERRAEEASRDVVSWLKCEYMQEHVGSEFPGVISAVTSFGLFVELVGIHVEGLVHVTNLSHDFYRFEQAAHALTGERTGKQYHLGDAIVVQVSAVNLEERKIDFHEVSHTESQGKRSRSKIIDTKKGGKKKSLSKAKKPQKTPQEDKVVKAKAIKGRAGSDKVTKKISRKAGAAANDVADKTINPEQRRQQKRQLKQKRRDEKRAVLREQKAQTPTTATGSNKTTDVKASAVAPTSAKRKTKKKAAASRSTTSAISTGRAVKGRSSVRDLANINAEVDHSRDKAVKKLAKKKSQTAKRTAAGTTTKKAASKSTGQSKKKVTRAEAPANKTKTQSKASAKKTSTAKSSATLSLSKESKKKTTAKKVTKKRVGRQSGSSS